MNNIVIPANVGIHALILACWLTWIPAFAGMTYALTIESPLPDAAQEAQAKELFYELRCVVCQGESIADSPADVARDMRAEVRAQVKKGNNAQDIKKYFTDRYGDFVLMRPPLNQATALLWLGPVLIVSVALFMAFVFFYRPRFQRSKRMTIRAPKPPAGSER